MMPDNLLKGLVSFNICQLPMHTVCMWALHIVSAKQWHQLVMPSKPGVRKYANHTNPNLNDPVEQPLMGYFN